MLLKSIKWLESHSCCCIFNTDTLSIKRLNIKAILTAHKGFMIPQRLIQDNEVNKPANASAHLQLGVMSDSRCLVLFWGYVQLPFPKVLFSVGM